MTIFKEGDGVRVKPDAYNINDRRVGMLALVTRVDQHDGMLPVRIEYQSGDFSWTNHESLELVTEAPSNHAQVGADILDKMVELKASIVARDNAIKLVIEQTEALDALLASVGLKRGEETPAAPVVPVAASRNALQDYKDETIHEGDRYQCRTFNADYFTEGKTYEVETVDQGDEEMPVAFVDDAGDTMYLELEHLKQFIRVC